MFLLSSSIARSRAFGSDHDKFDLLGQLLRQTKKEPDAIVMDPQTNGNHHQGIMIISARYLPFFFGDQKFYYFYINIHMSFH